MTKKITTQQEFYEFYANNSGVTVDFLKKNDQIAIPCWCEEENCTGWQIVNKNSI